MNTNVLCAVFKRNFVNYFANPTGYVFICVFLLLSSCAAFRPSEFFSANLANLDALNAAITLSCSSSCRPSRWAFGPTRAAREPTNCC